MIIDGLLQFSAAQNLAQAVGSYDSTNTFDLGVNGLPTSPLGGGARDLGIGDDPTLKILCEVVQAFTSGGAGTLQVQLFGAPDNGAGAPGAWTMMDNSIVVPLANLGLGSRLFDVAVTRTVPGQPMPRFLKLTYVIAGAAFTAGAVSADIVLNRYDQPHGPTGLDSAYPPGIVIAN